MSQSIFQGVSSCRPFIRDLLDHITAKRPLLTTEAQALCWPTLDNLPLRLSFRDVHTFHKYTIHHLNIYCNYIFIILLFLLRCFVLSIVGALQLPKNYGIIGLQSIKQVMRSRLLVGSVRPLAVNWGLRLLATSKAISLIGFVSFLLLKPSKVIFEFTRGSFVFFDNIFFVKRKKNFLFLFVPFHFTSKLVHKFIYVYSI